ncbi:segregation and condensation protein A [Sinomonas halotolerans]|uniref:Segregation and condensation protein A n=1 Tax=Sinomonas halotolerans TaxID=1644133 RepID=A0ABU9X325_9MICC
MALPDETPAEPSRSGFEVRLTNFTGPFDLLLGLIAKRRLDVTEVALATVTDDFIAYTRALQDRGEDWELDEASEFLVIAATLLDLKAARLLPAGEVEDEEDVARLEARDLLFARLLQYKAFKEVAGIFAGTLEVEARRYPRSVTLEPAFAALLPELVWRHTPAEFAALAAAAFAPKEAPASEVSLGHLHAPPVSVREQAAVLGARLRAAGSLSFRALTDDADSRLVVVARFLALLELFRDRAVAFEQAAPLAELMVRWTAAEGWTAERVSEEYEDWGQQAEPGEPGEPAVPRRYEEDAADARV